LSKQKISNTNDLDKFLSSIDEEEYSWLEYQAYSFANQVLVPKKLLFSQIKKLTSSIPSQSELEIIYPLLEDLSEIFKVSSSLMFRRLEKEGIVKLSS